MSAPLYENLPEKINKNRRNMPKDFLDLVYCIGWHENEKWKEIEISSDLSVYPCCALHAEHQLNKKFLDNVLDNLEVDWNSLKKHSMSDIMKIWRNHIKPEFWRNEKTLPECCKTLCKIK